ncbi:FG-GAP repeat domain-containing protein [Symbioplanes lichenis]|uniref:FG-GAP repeat domain-containing protein n=1 Tax=Symbioplanes lichenis TaxID=1629072 RepID=UPI002739A4B2|nr:VCBS repeat-containing protein [Actinoplanes lichenis]
MKAGRLTGALVAAVVAAGTMTSPAAAYVPAYTFAGIADWDRDRHQDVIARDAAGDLWLYPGESRRGYSGAARARIGNGWQGYTFAGVADWDRDGHQDIVARDGGGDLWLYRGQSKRRPSTAARVQIGNGWQGFTFAGIADWDRDGHQDIVARDGGGDLWLYRGQSRRGYSTARPVKIGNGWQGYDFAGVEDWDRDRHQDIVARDSGGDLWLYRGQSKRRPSTAARVQIGNGWQGYDFAGVADWDRDRHQDIVTRDGDGDLWLYPGESKRGYSTQPRVQIGNGW